MLAVLGRSIIRKKSSTGKGCMSIRRSGWQIDDLGPLSSGTVTSWGWWHFGRRWRRLSSRLSVSVGGKCACSIASPLCWRILWCDILARKVSGCLVLTMHSRVLFYRSFHHSMPRKLNTPLHLLSDFGTRFLIRNCVSCNAGREKPSLAMFATFKARCMLDCSSCTRPHCLAIVADMSKTYKILVAACNDEIRRLPQPYTLL